MWQLDDPFVCNELVKIWYPSDDKHGVFCQLWFYGFKESKTAEGVVF